MNLSPSTLTALGAVEEACRPSKAQTVALATILSDRIHHSRKLFFSHAKKTCIRLVACVMRHECTCLRMRMPNGGFRHPILSGIFSWDHVLCISCFTCTSCMENRARVMREHGACCMHVSAYCMHTRPPSGKVALPIDPHGSIFMTHAKNRMNFHAFRPDATSRPISALGACQHVFRPTATNNGPSGWPIRAAARCP